MSVFEREALIELDMLLDVKLASEVLHAHVVDVQIVPRSDSANPIENILGALRPRDRAHHHVSIGQNVVDGAGHVVGDLLRALEGHVAGHSYRDIGEVAIAGATNANAINLKHTFHAGNSLANSGSHTGGSGIEQGVDRFARETPAYIDDHSGHK